VINIIVTNIIKWVTFTEEYLCRWFFLNLGEIMQVYQETAKPGSSPETTVGFDVNDLKKDWLVCAGTTYCLVGSDNADVQSLIFKRSGKAQLPVIVMDPFDDSEEDNEVKVINPPPVHLQSSSGCKPDVGSDDLQVGLPDHITLNPSPREICDQVTASLEIAPDESSNDNANNVY
jgi:hypothetical protein